MMKDLVELIPRGSRLVCLPDLQDLCPQLAEKHGFDYFSKPYNEVINLIPKEQQETGVACIDATTTKIWRLRYPAFHHWARRCRCLGLTRQS